MRAFIAERIKIKQNKILEREWTHLYIRLYLSKSDKKERIKNLKKSIKLIGVGDTTSHHRRHQHQFSIKQSINIKKERLYV